MSSTLCISVKLRLFPRKINNHLLRQIGVIPKKLFSPDFETIRLIIKSVKQGFPVIMCPEGCLSVDGVNYKSTLETGKLIKKLEIPVVLVLLMEHIYQNLSGVKDLCVLL